MCVYMHAIIRIHTYITTTTALHDRHTELSTNTQHTLSGNGSGALHRASRGFGWRPPRPNECWQYVSKLSKRRTLTKSFEAIEPRMLRCEVFFHLRNICFDCDDIVVHVLNGRQDGFLRKTTLVNVQYKEQILYRKRILNRGGRGRRPQPSGVEIAFALQLSASQRHSSMYKNILHRKRMLYREHRGTWPQNEFFVYKSKLFIKKYSV
jgi:hypothetical protein